MYLRAVWQVPQNVKRVKHHTEVCVYAHQGLKRALDLLEMDYKWLWVAWCGYREANSARGALLSTAKSLQAQKLDIFFNVAFYP